MKAWRWISHAGMLVLALHGAAAGQSGIEGFVRDGERRPVAAAEVGLYRGGAPVIRGSAHSSGYYRLRAAPGEYEMRVERLGYAGVSRVVTVASDTLLRVDVVLSEAALPVARVTVEGARARARFEGEAGTTTRELSRGEVKLIPGLAEPDVLRAIEVLPGVITTSDFSSAFNVRGGSADQNLILLDGIPIFNPFHLGGLFSVFNSDLVARAELTAGGFPAQFGGRVSSVLNVESDAGGGAGWDVDGGISLLAARAAVGRELPSSWSNAVGLSSTRVRLAARRSYFDQLFRPIFEFPYHLTDVQLAAEAWTFGGGRLSVSGYTGRDLLDFSGVDSFPLRMRWGWGNDLIGARFQRAWQAGYTLDVSAGYTRFHTDISFPDFSDTQFRSRIGQWLARADLEIGRGGAFDSRVGFELNQYEYDNAAMSGGTAFRRSRESAGLIGSYAQTRWEKPGEWLVEAGVRADGWAASRSTFVAAPRLAVKRFITRDAALKLAVGRYAQFMHSLRDEALPIGIDVWVLAGERAPYTTSDQIQGGIEVVRGPWTIALEAFHRDFDGVASNNFADDPNDNFDDLVRGTGRSYGADLLVRRDTGRVRGFVSASWLRARRSFADPTTGVEPPPVLSYAPIFDRRFDVDVVLRTLLPREWELGARWNLGAGLPHTRPLASYALYDHRLDGMFELRRAGDSTATAILLGPRNSERYPVYHRLDLSLRKTFLRSWGTLTPHLDILNVYNRKNVLFWFYEYDRDPPRRSGVSMFPLLPTVGVEVSF